jgi:type IV pilus assembly protein PilC
MDNNNDDKAGSDSTQQSLGSSIKEQLSRELQSRGGKTPAADSPASATAAAAAAATATATADTGATAPRVSAPKRIGGIFGGRIKRREVYAFCEELSLLLECGMPMIKALRSLQTRWDNPVFARLIGQVGDSVENGRMLSQALEEHDGHFSSSLISMLRAGEKSGKLGQMLARVAEHGENVSAFKEKLISMMIYPALIFIAVGIVIFLVMRLVNIMGDFLQAGPEGEAALPASMQFLLSVGNASRSVGLWATLVVLLVAVVVGWIMAMRVYACRLLRDRICMRVPVLCHFVKQAALVNFARILSTLLHSGVPLPEALDATHDAAQNEVVKLTIERVQGAVERGERITPSLRHSDVFPNVTYELSDVGEETGTLDRVFTRLADVYEEKQRTELEMLSKVVQPIILLCLAMVVGFVLYAVLSSYLDMFRSLQPAG